MSRIWFTADPHYCHIKVGELRREAGLFKYDPRDFITDNVSWYHDYELVKRWNDVVDSDDIVWLLGDFGVGNPDHYLPIVNLLNGRIRLITGNHDKPWPGHSTAHKYLREWLEYFEVVEPFAKINVGNRQVLLSHFPYAGDHTREARHMEYRLHDEGKWLIHGHVHNKWLRNGRQINVGVDRWNLTPVNLSDIDKIITVTEEYWMDVGYRLEMAENS